MDEINEQTENMKQIQEALATPIGAAADFDEVFLLSMLLGSLSSNCMRGKKNVFWFSTSRSNVKYVNWLCDCRTSWKQSLKNWKVQSWRNSFFNQRQQPPRHQCKCQPAGYQLVLLRSARLRKMNLQRYRQKWHFEQVVPLYL